MTRLENICNFVKGEVERTNKVKIDIIQGWNSVSVEVLYPYNETVYSFDVPINQMVSIDPDEVVDNVKYKITNEWLRRIKRDL